MIDQLESLRQTLYGREAIEREIGTERQSTMTKSRRLRLLLVLVVLAVAACAPSANPLTDQALGDGSPAGFLSGVWHGFIVVITFVISLFSDSVGVYEVHNTGWSYDLGYLLGLMMALGGGGAGARGKR